jgi:hypothetical protein
MEFLKNKTISPARGGRKEFFMRIKKNSKRLLFLILIITNSFLYPLQGKFIILLKKSSQHLSKYLKALEKLIRAEIFCHLSNISASQFYPLQGRK